MKCYLEGTPEQVEQAIRLADKGFRSAYNVYGVRRMATGYDRESGMYHATIAWEPAQWTVFGNLFPEYTPRGVYGAWLNRVSRFRELDELFVEDLK